jgi:hypothetical protein
VEREGYPVIFSPNIIDGERFRVGKDRVYLSSDGAVIGRWTQLGTQARLELFSSQIRFVRRVLLLFPEENRLHQSSDGGHVVIPLPEAAPDGVDRFEVIPPAGHARYPAVRDGRQRDLPPQILLDAGDAGTVVVEQEESDAGETVLHIALSGIPSLFRTRRLFAALEDHRQKVLVEEAIGQDIYFYGPDLFRSFLLWIYIR